MAKGTPSALEGILFGPEAAQRLADDRATKEQQALLERLARDTAAQRELLERQARDAAAADTRAAEAARADAVRAAEQQHRIQEHNRLLKEHNQLLFEQINEQRRQARRLEPVLLSDLVAHGIADRADELRTRGQFEDFLAARRRESAEADAQRKRAREQQAADEFHAASRRRLTAAEGIVFGMRDRPTVAEAKARFETYQIGAAEYRLSVPAHPGAPTRRDHVEAVFAAVAVPMLAAVFGWWTLAIGFLMLLIIQRDPAISILMVTAVLGVLDRTVFGLHHWIGAALIAGPALLYGWRDLRKITTAADRDAVGRRRAQAVLDTEARSITEARAELKAITFGIHPDIPRLEWSNRATLRLLWTYARKELAAEFQEMCYRASAETAVRDRLAQWFDTHPAWQAAPDDVREAEVHRAMTGFDGWYRTIDRYRNVPDVLPEAYAATITLPPPLPGGTPDPMEGADAQAAGPHDASAGTRRFAGLE